MIMIMMAEDDQNKSCHANGVGYLSLVQTRILIVYLRIQIIYLRIQIIYFYGLDVKT